MQSKYTVLVNSSDGFEDCWAPFFTLFKKYWTASNAPIYLNTEKKSWSFPGLDIHCTQVQADELQRLPWSECLIRALDQIESPLVLYFQEDYFIHQDVRDEVVNSAVEYMLAHPEVEHIGLTKHGSMGPYEPYDATGLQKIRQNARYRISTQAGLWRVDALKSYLVSEENGWMFEIYGTWRAHKRPAVFLTTEFDTASGGPAIDYLHTGIIKGQWLSGMQKVFADNEINMDFSKRGFYVPKHFLVHKFEVGRKLLSQPIYFLKNLVFMWSGIAL